MLEFVKAMNSYSLAMFFFGFKQMQNILTPSNRGENKGPAIKAMEALTAATEEQFGRNLDTTFQTIDALLRVATDATLFVMFPFIALLGQDSRRDHNGKSYAVDTAESRTGGRA
jgi:hypothetical protein